MSRGKDACIRPLSAAAVVFSVAISSGKRTCGGCVTKMGDIQRGTCKWFDSKKGFGFITAEDGTDLFVHQTAIKAAGFRNLCEGEEVEFLVQSGDDGRKKAVNVTGPGGGPVKAAAGGADITEEGTMAEAMVEEAVAVMEVAATPVAMAAVGMATAAAEVMAEVGTAAVTAEVGAAGVIQVGTAVATAVETAVATVEAATAAPATEGVTGVVEEVMGTLAVAAGEADTAVVDMVAAATTTTYECRFWVVPPS
ncbi:glycine-rich protein 2, putative [Eimeria praecox]|uniref:Glycine-rich protein 2, putative n=1 Tax=Eimeria praecox TaxID=51316 RepID=U6H6B5_9EIME|nr:glycine-rich protein 2, putative [Eimeria praecox]